MRQKIMYIFTRTPLHVGAGNSVGAIDSPIQRERHTKIPIIPGSSLKGVLVDLWNDADNTVKDEKTNSIRRKKESELIKLFGSDDPDAASAGELLIGEARVLAFPVRSAKNAFAWITCPLALARYKRDANASFDIPIIDSEDECFAVEELRINNSIILEEYKFKVKADVATDILSDIKEIIDDDVWQDIGSRFAIVHDEVFSYFVENACEVVTRIRVNDETGTVDSGALFNQEHVPSETMFYAVIGDRKNNDGKNIKTLKDRLGYNDNIIQIGGDETIGLGYCSVALDVE